MFTDEIRTYSSDDYPGSLYSEIFDTLYLGENLYRAFAPNGKGPTENWFKVWLRTEFRKIYALNISDSTEYLLFDFTAEEDESWEIPPDGLTPVNQCIFGKRITLVSKYDTVINSGRTHYNCITFEHSEQPCFDAGIVSTTFASDYGIVEYSRITEGGVQDWTLYEDNPDTLSYCGTFTFIGNPCYTIPCLPGIVCALKCNNEYYVITINDNMLNEPPNFDGYIPMVNDSLEIKGIITKRRDINSKEYWSLEALDLKRIATTNINTETIIECFQLYQNYSNPFNPVTTIKYTIPTSEFRIQNSELVSLRIYDILGREVATLVNEQQRPGNYEAKWNADGYSSGVYYYKLTSGKFTESKKMILLR